jgi:hypothetical protein
VPVGEPVAVCHLIAALSCSARGEQDLVLFYFPGGPVLECAAFSRLDGAPTGAHRALDDATAARLRAAYAWFLHKGAAREGAHRARGGPCPTPS